jgi:two-component system nitrate/nitrite response regulator NarL
LPTIALVDDHLLLVETLQAVLRVRGVQTVCFGPELGAELLPSLIAAYPDLVLLDLDLGGFGDSTVLIRPLTAAGIRVLVVTGLSDRLRIALALEQGAIGYQSKAAGFDALLMATERALALDEPMDWQDRQSMFQELERKRTDKAKTLLPFESLTDREQATLLAVCDGLTVSQIAGAWMVSPATVRSHVQRVLGKLGVGSQVQAVSMAMRSGWLALLTAQPSR